MRVVFMGSPEFALPSLRRLLDAGHDVAAVYTQPDRPAGRGRRIIEPPVKRYARERGLNVRQPKSISKPEVVEEIRSLGAEAAVIAAYGQILKQPVLDAFPRGVLNVHASLLPRWRGAAPVAAAIRAGDEETGVTIMLVRLELDAGPVLDSVRVRIAPEDTTGTLTQKIAEAGAGLLVGVLPKWQSGSLEPREQDASQATYAPQVTKQDGLIRWSRDNGHQIWRQVRACNPWPMAFSYLDGKPLRIVEATPLHDQRGDTPGTIFVFTGANETSLRGAGFGVVTAAGALGVITVQPSGGRPMPAAAYLNGHRDIVGKRFTEAP